MKQYLLSIYQPAGRPAEEKLTRVMSDLGALTEEMRAAGAWVFSGGLHPPGSATVVRARDNEVLTTDGPFIEAKEFLGGFTVVRAPDLDVALEWGRKLATVLEPLAVEVRPFQGDE
jgi:hypothetical protein